MRFSIVIVCLNAGERLKSTVDSVLGQTRGDYEIIVKDGGSSDGSLDFLKQDGYREEQRIRFFQEKDRGIYDAMNQAVSHASGEYVSFLNCGDSFYDASVLERLAEFLAEEKPEGEVILYGDTYDRRNQTLVTSPPRITGFTCYRHLPCHQSFFYARTIFDRKNYDPAYRVRADYEHLLWCFFAAGIPMRYLNFTVSDYEGGGFSETKENAKKSDREHREITMKYIPSRKLAGYRFLMAVTLAPLRKYLADQSPLAGLYNAVRRFWYRKKG